MDYNYQCGCKTGKINGIKCEVKDCTFHTTNDCCEAGQIVVGSKDATCSSQTSCNTFRERQ